jgi:hypothetical protein
MRTRRWRAQLAATCLVVLVGCYHPPGASSAGSSGASGSTGGTSGSSSGGASDSTAVAFCASFDSRFCDLLTGCGFADSNCLDYVQPVLGTPSGCGIPNQAVVPDRAAACLGELDEANQRRDCAVAGLIYGMSGMLYGDCQGALDGAIPLGGSCTWSQECQRWADAGLIACGYSAAHGPGCGTICVAGNLGDSCEYNTCVEGACAGPGWAQTCVPYPAEGEACQLLYRHRMRPGGGLV